MEENILMLCYTTYKYKIYITKQVNKNVIKNYKKETYQANKQTSKSSAKRSGQSRNQYKSVPIGGSQSEEGASIVGNTDPSKNFRQSSTQYPDFYIYKVLRNEPGSEERKSCPPFRIFFQYRGESLSGLASNRL